MTEYPSLEEIYLSFPQTDLILNFAYNQIEFATNKVVENLTGKENAPGSDHKYILVLLVRKSHLNLEIYNLSFSGLCRNPLQFMLLDYLKNYFAENTVN